MDGVVTLDNASKAKYDNGFVKLKAEEKHALLLTIDGEASKYKDTRNPEDPETHYYSMMKQLNPFGIFHFRSRGHQGA